MSHLPHQQRARKELYLVETSDQALRLLGHAPLYAPLDHSLNVLLLVLLGHGDSSPARLQLSLCDLQNRTHTGKP